jgi:hypothetical protein
VAQKDRFVYALFLLQKRALLDWYWTRAKLAGPGHSEAACTKIWFRSCNEQAIGELYYYDEAADRVQSLDCLPGLQVARWTPLRLRKVRAGVHCGLVARYGNSDSALLTVIREGLRHIDKRSPLMRALYFNAWQGRSSMVLTSPQKTDWLCNVMVPAPGRSEHIYTRGGEAEKLLHSLYRCHYNTVFPATVGGARDQSAEHCPEYVVLQYVKANRRFSELAATLGLWQRHNTMGGNRQRSGDAIDELYSEDTTSDDSSATV